jgi:hypothetical protein
MHWGLWNYLTALTLVLEVVFASCGFVYVRRLLKREAVPLTIQVRSVRFPPKSGQGVMRLV